MGLEWYSDTCDEILFFGEEFLDVYNHYNEMSDSSKCNLSEITSVKFN